MMNNDDKYQVESTDAYGIKKTKGGQKYLICHFIRDDFVDKYAYENVIDPKSELATSILLEKECNKGEYFYEPFVHRAIGYVVSGYDNLKGFSVKNADTDQKGDANLTKGKQEHEFIKQLSDNLKNFKSDDQYDISENYWQQLEKAVNEISGDLIFVQKLRKISEEYYSALVRDPVFASLQLKALLHNCKSIKELKDIIENENKINSVPENNQMNISGAKISSLIINITNKIFRRVNWYRGGVNNSKKDRLYEIVKNINEIIDIQFNKLGHKSILVRDAEDKKIQTMSLDTFVDYIKDECVKVGIDEKEIKKINPNFPTKKKVYQIIYGRWFYPENYRSRFHINTVSGSQYGRNLDKNCNIF